jgi:hypothetical protein
MEEALVNGSDVDVHFFCSVSSLKMGQIRTPAESLLELKSGRL